MRGFRIFLLVIAILNRLFAQELYPYAEPASTLPARMVGFKIANEIFSDISTKTKYYTGFRVFYGLHKYCTVGITTGISNHHLKEVPKNYIYYLLNHHSRRYPNYPTLLEGIHLSAKFRLLSQDRFKSHWRLAFLLEGSKSFTVHDEAEPNLMTDNSGYGIHIIGTRLYRRWALNLQMGTIHPLSFRQEETETGSDYYIRYSDAVQVILSNGFRIYPSRFKNFSQTNVNVYAELHYKQYGAAYVENAGRQVDFEKYRQFSPYLSNSMSGNSYVDLRTYVQFIIASQSRIELGLVFSAYSRSYLHNYPMFSFQFQRFLFGRK